MSHEQILVSVHCRDIPLFKQAILRDVDASGGFLQSERPMPVGSVVTLAPIRNPEIQVSARVALVVEYCRSAKSSDIEVPGMNLMFESTGSSLLEYLEEATDEKTIESDEYIKNVPRQPQYFEIGYSAKKTTNRDDARYEPKPLAPLPGRILTKDIQAVVLSPISAEAIDSPDTVTTELPQMISAPVIDSASLVPVNTASSNIEEPVPELPVQEEMNTAVIQDNGGSPTLVDNDPPHEDLVYEIEADYLGVDEPEPPAVPLEAAEEANEEEDFDGDNFAGEDQDNEEEGEDDKKKKRTRSRGGRRRKRKK